MSKKKLYLSAIKAPQTNFQVLNSLLLLLHQRAEHRVTVCVCNFPYRYFFFEVLKSYWHIIKIYSEYFNLTCIFFNFSSRLRRISSMGITNANVFPLPVTCESGNSVSPPSAPESSQENNELDEGKDSPLLQPHLCYS